MKLKALAMSALLVFSNISVAADKEAVVSTASLGGECKSVPRDEDKNTAENALIVGMIASAVVSESISYVAKWLTDFKDTFKGADSATNVGYFFCSKSQNKNDIGIHEDLIYKRFELSSNKTLIEIKSKIEILKGIEGSVGFFTITPDSLSYFKPIAKNGKVKDVTVVYSFTFFAKDGSEKTMTSDPILFESVKTGSTLINLKAYGTKAIFPLPESLRVKTKDSGKSFFETPYKLTIQVSEVSPGKGVELAGNIAKSIGESLDKENDALTKLIISKIIKDDKPADSGQTQEDEGEDKGDEKAK